MHLSMKWKLILSFTAVVLFFLGVALYQNYKINQVKVSMVTQKVEMEKRITVSIITQLLQEMNGVEASLAGSSDLEFAQPFIDKYNKLKEELAKVKFDAASPASKDLELLHSQLEEYVGYFDGLVDTLGDTSHHMVKMMTQHSELVVIGRIDLLPQIPLSYFLQSLLQLMYWIQERTYKHNGNHECEQKYKYRRIRNNRGCYI